MPDEQLLRLPGGAHRDRGHRIEPEQREIGEIVARERFAAQVGVHEPQPAKPALPTAHTTDVGQEDLGGVADHHVRDGATPVDEDPDLAMQRRALLGELGCELHGDDLRRGHPPPVQALQRLDLAGLESGEVAGHLGLHFGSILPAVDAPTWLEIYPLCRGLPRI